MNSVWLLTDMYMYICTFQVHRGIYRMISEEVPVDQITVLTLRIRTERPEQTT